THRLIEPPDSGQKLTRNRAVRRGRPLGGYPEIRRPIHAVHWVELALEAVDICAEPIRRQARRTIRMKQHGTKDNQLFQTRLVRFEVLVEERRLAENVIIQIENVFAVRSS